MAREKKKRATIAGVPIGAVSRVLLSLAAVVLLAFSILAVFVTKTGDGVLVALVVVAGVALLLGFVGVLPNSFAIGGNEVRFSSREIESIEKVLRDNEVSDADIAKVMSILDKADPRNEALDAALDDAKASSNFEDEVREMVSELPETSVRKDVTVAFGAQGGKGRPPILQGVVTMPDGTLRILQTLTSSAESQINRAKSRVQRTQQAPEYERVAWYFVTPSEGVANSIRKSIDREWLDDHQVQVVDKKSLIDALRGD